VPLFFVWLARRQKMGEKALSQETQPSPEHS